MGQIELTTEDFDISKIAKSGQCFRISKHPNKENVWCVIAKGKYLEVEQKEPGWRLIKKIKGIEAKQKEPGKTILHCSVADFESTWEDYFDLAMPYKMIRNTIDPEDKYLTEAAADGKGIRILKQDLWEVMISFIISQNNNIPRIKRSIETLCEINGKGHELEDGRLWYEFPKPEDLMQSDGLKPAALGYREKYIQRLAENVVKGKVSLEYLMDDQKSDAEIRNYLESIYGIGPKVANCIMLFGLHRLDSFPRDKWINEIIREKYNGKFPIERYKGFAGVIQQYLFDYTINKGQV